MSRRGKVLLAVDLSYQTYRATAAHSTLKSIEGVFTGGLFGFMVTVSKIIRESGADAVVICEDVKPYRRSLEYPAYKMLRKKNEDSELRDNAQASLLLVKELLEVVGIPIMRAPGFESDDCIGHIVTQHRHRYRMIYAASNDSDLYALFWCPWFRVWQKDADDIMDYWKLKEKTGLTPEEFHLASALRGTHNDIEGIAGVGEKKSSEAVKNPGLMRKYQEGHGSMIERNLRLTALPHAEFPRDMAVPRSTKPFDARALYRWAGKYDITVTQSMVSAFEQVSP